MACVLCPPKPLSVVSLTPSGSNDDTSEIFQFICIQSALERILTDNPSCEDGLAWRVNSFNACLCTFLQFFFYERNLISPYFAYGWKRLEKGKKRKVKEEEKKQIGQLFIWLEINEILEPDLHKYPHAVL